MHEVMNLPIKKGGLGIPALLDIEQPALMSSYYRIIQDTTLVELLQCAGIMHIRNVMDGWQDRIEQIGDSANHSSRTFEFLL
jgi:hypothetical protein